MVYNTLLQHSQYYYPKDQLIRSLPHTILHHLVYIKLNHR